MCKHKTCCSPWDRGCCRTNKTEDREAARPTGEREGRRGEKIIISMHHPSLSTIYLYCIYLQVCVTFVFGALLEYALVNYASRSDAQRLAKKKVQKQWEIDHCSFDPAHMEDALPPGAGPPGLPGSANNGGSFPMVSIHHTSWPVVITIIYALHAPSSRPNTAATGESLVSRKDFPKGLSLLPVKPCLPTISSSVFFPEAHAKGQRPPAAAATSSGASAWIRPKPVDEQVTTL